MVIMNKLINLRSILASTIIDKSKTFHWLFAVSFGNELNIILSKRHLLSRDWPNLADAVFSSFCAFFGLNPPFETITSYCNFDYDYFQNTSSCSAGIGKGI